MREQRWRKFWCAALITLLFSCASGKQTLAWEIIHDAGAIPGDTFLPWAGGPAYYAQWPRGLPSDPSFVMLSVWMQNPINVTRFREVGINFFTGLWQGPTAEQMLDLAKTPIPVICDQAGVWRDHLNERTIEAWLQPDGPDNAQLQLDGSYGPCIEPTTIVDEYAQKVKNDPSRPVFLGLGRGVAVTDWIGRGTCTGRTDMYPEYAKGGDILAFNDYPASAGEPIESVAAGVDHLLTWSDYKKPVIAVLEASDYTGENKLSPEQIKSEVWMTLVHGASGVVYYCHRMLPTIDETNCLDEPATAAALQKINDRITKLASVLNTQSVGNGVTVASLEASIPVDTMLKRYGGATFLFAVEMRGGTTKATFQLRDFPASASAEVLDETRTLHVVNGRFEDDFQSYGVHLYRITF
jgi:hypothetical protein